MKSGWQIKPIGTVCDLATGGTPSRTKPEYFGGDIRWLVSGDINKGEIFECEGRITEAGKKNSNAKLLPINSVMIALNGQGKTRGTVALLRTQATCNQSLVSISPKQSTELLPEFLYANLHGRYEEIRRMTSDDDKDRRGLNMGLIRSIMIPIPPLDEQKRIISKLDEAFAGLAKAKENAEKNLQNARALFESHLESVFTNRGPGWNRKPLGSLCHLVSGQHIDAKDYNTEGKGIGYLTGPSDFGFLNPIITKWSEHPKRIAKRGDILITVKGSGVGKINLLDQEEVAISRQLMAVRATIVDVNFLYAFLSTNLRHFQSLSTGAAIPGISREDVLGLMCPIPKVEEQQVTVKLIHALSDETQSLARLYEQKLEALEALRKSILREAFSGNL